MEDLNNRRVSMDELCELSSKITEVACTHAGITDIDTTDENDNLIYKAQAQDIFNSVLDILDYELNDKKDESLCN